MYIHQELHGKQHPYMCTGVNAISHLDSVSRSLLHLRLRRFGFVAQIPGVQCVGLGNELPWFEDGPDATARRARRHLRRSREHCWHKHLSHKAAAVWKAHLTHEQGGADWAVAQSHFALVHRFYDAIGMHCATLRFG